MTSESHNRVNEEPVVQVLLVSEAREDHEYLRKLLDDPIGGLPADGPWTLHSSHSIECALALLEAHPIPIVLIACELGPHTWRDVLEALAPLSGPPLAIVISRLDDETLWTEALNLGVYDLLAKPFHADEVIRIMSQAWLRWKELHKAATAENPRYRTAHAS